GAAEVAPLDAIAVHDHETADAEEREVLHDLVSEGARAHDQDAGLGEPGLPPPLDGLQPGEAPLEDEGRGRAHGRAPPLPAVISGCSRSSSPLFTPASARVWVSRSWVPVRRWCSL